MPRKHYYFTLIASLPYLPRFDRATRLPINRNRLLDRLRMLEPDDAEVLERLGALFDCSRVPTARTEKDLEADVKWMEDQMKRRHLRGLFEFLLQVRIIMDALRRRTHGLPAPAWGEPWGMGPLVERIRQNWEVRAFRLGADYPWASKACDLLEQGEMLALQRLIMNVTWDGLDRLTDGREFEFAAVLAYLVKWSVLFQWLSQDKERAATRFDELLAEVIGEHKPFVAPQ